MADLLASTEFDPVVPNPSLRAVVGATCSLSIVGSLLIILSYIFIKSLRTTTRLVLVHLSVMDLGVAAANLFGISVNFNQYYISANQSDIKRYPSGYPEPLNPGPLIDNACVAQAALAVYFTSGSFMWTLSMAVFLYFRIVHYQNKLVAKHTLWTATVLCYVLPLLNVGWKCAMGRLGYSPFDATGWCGDKIVDLVTGEKHILMSVLGYNIWVVLIYIFVPILYLSLLLHLQSMIKQASLNLSSQQFWKIDVKLLFIPIFFLLLRIWSFVSTVTFLYMNDPRMHHSAHEVLQYLSGFGDSGQGFVNAILFVFLTKRVRDQLFCGCCIKRNDPLDEELKNESRSLLR